jgi:hypothetical protein
VAWPALLTDICDYMKVFVGDEKPASKAKVAQVNVLAPDIATMSLYENAAANTQRHFMGQHLVILALFSGEDGTSFCTGLARSPCRLRRLQSAVNFTNRSDTPL